MESPAANNVICGIMKLMRKELERNLASKTGRKRADWLSLREFAAGRRPDSEKGGTQDCSREGRGTV